LGFSSTSDLELLSFGAEDPFLALAFVALPEFLFLEVFESELFSDEELLYLFEVFGFSKFIELNILILEN
jgi:hypothetical protein